MCVLSSFSHVGVFVIPWTVARQAPLSLGFSRQEHWRGLPCLLQGTFLTRGSNSCLWRLLYRQAGSFPLVPTGKPIAGHMYTPDLYPLVIKILLQLFSLPLSSCLYTHTHTFYLCRVKVVDVTTLHF